MSQKNKSSFFLLSKNYIIKIHKTSSKIHKIFTIAMLINMRTEATT